jgi:hypothetical protein
MLNVLTMGKMRLLIYLEWEKRLLHTFQNLMFQHIPKVKKYITLTLKSSPRNSPEQHGGMYNDRNLGRFAAA